jgi:hypothetical protein
MKNEHDGGSAEEEKRVTSENRANDLHTTAEQTINVSEQDGIDTSSIENSRSQGSQGSRAVSIAEVSVSAEASRTVKLCDPMIMQIPSSVHDQSPTIVTSTSHLKPKIRYTDDGRYDDVFWLIYDELESASDKRTVNGRELKARLVSSNKFFVGDAVLITERMVSTGQLCLIGYDTYQRKTN